MADVSGDLFVAGPGGFYRKSDRSGPYAINSQGVASIIGASSLVLSPSPSGGYEKVTGLNTVKSLNKPTNANVALVRVSGAAVRFRADDTSPTATQGLPIKADEDFILFDNEIAAAKFIEQSTGAVIDVYYSRQA